MEKDDLFDFEFNGAEGCWSVTGYHGEDEEVIFPVSHEGKPVKKIGAVFSRFNKMIKRIVIPEGYTSIGKWAFENCKGLTEVKLPESFAYIKEKAFDGCTGLTEINLPKNLTFIKDNAFRACTGLTKITVDENNPVFCSLDGVLFDKAMTTLVLFPEGKKGGYSVPEGIVKIKFSVFDLCKELTAISFPQSLVSIESWFINWARPLTDITVNVNNPYYCSIDGVLFDKEKRDLIAYPRSRSKTEYSVPYGTQRIKKNAFSGCNHLVNIILPESLEIIDDYAFARCEGIKAITLPLSLKYIGGHAFEYSPKLKTITLSRKTRIGYRAFEGIARKFEYRD